MDLLTGSCKLPSVETCARHPYLGSMKFPDPLIRGRLVRRYKRFLADVELETGEQVVAHCANPGSMMGLAEPGMVVWLSPSRSPARKLKYSWELVAPNGCLVGINTSYPNAIVAESLEMGAISELVGYTRVRREVRYGQNSRIDILLEAETRPPCYVEIKNVTLKRRPGVAEFPDSVTKRGTKHLVELSEMARNGARAVMFFLVQRDDCDRVEIAADIDPAYANAFDAALESGIEVLCYNCKVRPESIELDRGLTVNI